MPLTLPFLGGMVLSMKPTPLQRLLSLHLGPAADVRTVISGLLADGRSLGYIAQHLTDLTDGSVPVSRQQVHAWVQRDGLTPTPEPKDATA